ncbi:aldehyde dehydrogenase family protein [Bradyrhizobium sp.]|uniref:aldehyde dehydrogenase family protein n=1 Tax=Bradyrhizobium sp. TaxID=376 RepID=UPI0039E4B3A0
MQDYDRLGLQLIDGEWLESESKFPVLDKFSGREFARVHSATREQVAHAVKVAKRAADAGCPAPYERARALYEASRLIHAHKEQFVDLMVAEAGFTIADAGGEVDRAKVTLELSAEVAKNIVGSVVPFGASPGAERRIGFTVRDPVGVVCAITPFNSPLNTVLHKIGPSFAAGNATVLKPSSETPLTAGLLGKLLLQAGMPKDFLSVIQGPGTVGEWLLAEQDIGFYTFTGSTRVGRYIQDHAGLRRTQMELGSIASTILCADGDLSNAIPKTANAGLRKAGQVCTSVQRLYVQDSIYDETLERLVKEARALKSGDPRDPATRVGPLISERAAQRGEQWIKDAVDAGARLVCGGKRDGRVLEPTILADVPEACSAWCQEAFAPLLVLRRFSRFEEALESANDTPYGLSVGVFTRDITTALTAVRKFRFGTVQINETSSARADVMPFGGVKESGFGKEGPAYAALEMTVERLIVLNP